MNHALIVAHPNPDSLSMQMARAYANAAAALRQETLIRDLYRIGFDPCLKLDEIPGRMGAAMGGDVQRERALLADVDVFAFFYPLWFNTPPAMLKGYVERVFGAGFGFEPSLSAAGMTPRLEGRRLISFTTSGAPDAWVRETGALDMLTAGFDRHVAAVCGMTFVDHVNFGGVVPGIGKDAVEDIRRSVRSTVGRVFDPAAYEIA